MNESWDGDRYWNGDNAVPRNAQEARDMGLEYDPATDSWWRGEVMVARNSTVERTRRIHRDGAVLRRSDDNDY